MNLVIIIGMILSKTGVSKILEITHSENAVSVSAK